MSSWTKRTNRTARLSLEKWKQGRGNRWLFAASEHKDSADLVVFALDGPQSSIKVKLA